LGAILVPLAVTNFAVVVNAVEQEVDVQVVGVVVSNRDPLVSVAIDTPFALARLGSHFVNEQRRNPFELLLGGRILDRKG